MDRIAEIRERLEKATPGVWRAGRNDTVSYHAWEDGGKAFKNVYCDAVNPEYYLDTPLPEIVAECRDVNGVDCRDIANFIANAHQDIPYLLGIIEQQQAEIEHLKPLAELGELAVAGVANIVRYCPNLANYIGLETFIMLDKAIADWRGGNAQTVKVHG